jgi:hypothetical protein
MSCRMAVSAAWKVSRSWTSDAVLGFSTVVVDPAALVAETVSSLSSLANAHVPPT